MANGHDASTTVQLQDIKEQQDLTVVDEESTSAPNGHRGATTAAFPIPTISVVPAVPKVADEGEGAVKRIDWEIPRKTLHSSIGLCWPIIAFNCSCSPRSATTGFGTIALYLGHYTVPPIIYGLLVALAVVGTGDYMRFRNKPFAEFYEKAVGVLMRESEKVGSALSHNDSQHCN